MPGKLKLSEIEQLVLSTVAGKTIVFEIFMEFRGIDIYLQQVQRDLFLLVVTKVSFSEVVREVHVLFIFQKMQVHEEVIFLKRLSMK